jgi:hypothetical protein
MGTEKTSPQTLDSNVVCNEWHILKGETQYGPYTYEEMIGMSQNGLVFGFGDNIQIYFTPMVASN